MLSSSIGSIPLEINVSNLRSMFGQKQILEKYERLSHLGYRPSLKPGTFVGRGFADVGSEVFYVHPAKKILSLFTGQAAILSEQEEGKIFAVPTVDEMVALLSERSISLKDLSFVEGRLWQGVIEANEDTYQFSASTLEELFLDILLYVYEEGE